jgi:hypothetical protein
MDKNRVSKIFTSVLQIHNKRPSKKINVFRQHFFVIQNIFQDLWIMAAKFEFEVNETPEIARQLFQRALRFLPDSQKLWLEVIIHIKIY